MIESDARDRPAVVEAFEGPRITVRGARTHNLRGLDVELPRHRWIVITGPSGSGKSSLAFDTIFAEGQRRYVESLSVSARQHLAQLPQPDVDLIEGLSPAVAIAQHVGTPHPRATVGSITEILDYLRLLFARTGEVFSHRTGEPMRRHSLSDMVEAVMAEPEGARVSILAPVVRQAPGDHAERLAELHRQGFVRVRVDGTRMDLAEVGALDPALRHDIAVYVDRLKMKEGIRARVADSLQTAATAAGGHVEIERDDRPPLRFSERFIDAAGELDYPEITPSTLSTGSVHGACSRCKGLGQVVQIDFLQVIPDPEAPMPGAVRPWAARGQAARRKAWKALANAFSLDPGTPWSALPEELKIVVVEGSAEHPGWIGLRPELEAAEREPSDDDVGSESLFKEDLCPVCEGTGLRIEARMVKIDGRSIADVSAMPLATLRMWLAGLAWPVGQREIAEAVLGQVRRRLAFLEDVGLGYLKLDRRAPTLSGGELQRIRLATQVGAALVGVTYILDEPSIGLHPRDNARLIAVLHRLRDLGNTVIVVEHDEDTMRAADWLVELGPGAGALGGRLIAAGTPGFIAGIEHSATGRLLTGRSEAFEAPRRPPATHAIVLEGATGHNLRDVDLSFPTGRLTCVTGVSGSGKSTAVIDTLLPEAARILNRAARTGLPHRRLKGLGRVDKVVHVDQSPIGRSGRSNPATYTGALAEIRTLFAALPESKIRGFAVQRFSFNVKGGRCEACQGEGMRRIEMHFLPDLYVTCERCNGARYNPETLTVRWKGKTIADVLALSIAQACEFFAAQPSLRRPFEVLRDVGLGYLELGQRADSLSGGEAQRLKLGRELARVSSGRTLYILDEPTTGLHAEDVRQLLRVLERLVDDGSTVVVIEHHLEVIAAADHVIDLGPEGGEGGGRIVAAGTVAQVMAVSESATGQALRERALRFALP